MCVYVRRTCNSHRKLILDFAFDTGRQRDSVALAKSHYAYFYATQKEMEILAVLHTKNRWCSP